MDIHSILQSDFSFVASLCVCANRNYFELCLESVLLHKQGVTVMLSNGFIRRSLLNHTAQCIIMVLLLQRTQKLGVV